MCGLFCQRNQRKKRLLVRVSIFCTVLVARNADEGHESNLPSFGLTTTSLWGPLARNANVIAWFTVDSCVSVRAASLES